jgi:pimeloyl-ACP methyl ester carboxylesterase
MGAHQSFLAAKEVYALLGCEDRINMAIDSGGHSLSDEAMEQWMDWLDLQFDRRQGHFKNQLMYDYAFERWQQRTCLNLNVMNYPRRGLDDLMVLDDGRAIVTVVDWQTKRCEIEERMRVVVGELPDYRLPDSPHLERAQVYDQYWTFRTEGGLVTDRLALDGGLVCHLTYREADAQNGSLPVVVYCHQYNDQRGFAWQRHEQAGVHVSERLADLGFLVVEFDLFGYGRRNHDAGLDYWTAHPDRSALGMMIGDVHQILDALEAVALADTSRMAVIGYSLGGTVALHASALDQRVGACVSICGMGSMRLDRHSDETEGLGRYCLLRPTLPRLGYFVGQEDRVPYDYHELLALIAPRYAMIVAPELDQDWLHEDVLACYKAAQSAYAFWDATDQLALEVPYDFNRYPPKLQDRVNAWLCRWASVKNRWCGREALCCMLSPYHAC